MDLTLYSNKFRIPSVTKDQPYVNHCFTKLKNRNENLFIPIELPENLKDTSLTFLEYKDIIVSIQDLINKKIYITLLFILFYFLVSIFCILIPRKNQNIMLFSITFLVDIIIITITYLTAFFAMKSLIKRLINNLNDKYSNRNIYIHHKYKSYRSGKSRKVLMKVYIYFGIPQTSSNNTNPILPIPAEPFEMTRTLNSDDDQSVSLNKE